MTDVESMAAALLAEAAGATFSYAKSELERARYCDYPNPIAGLTWGMWSRIAQIALDHFDYLPSECDKRRERAWAGAD